MTEEFFKPGQFKTDVQPHRYVSSTESETSPCSECGYAKHFWIHEAQIEKPSK